MRFPAMMAAMGAVAVAAGCTPQPEAPVSRAAYPEYFGQYCAACHGADATGTARAPDLTRISARNGGTFPMTAVMSQIDGYGQGGTMPEFGEFVLDDRPVAVELETGEVTTAPERLAGMAEYLRTLQR